MRTSIDIPDPLLRRARRVARSRGTTLRALVVDGLRALLNDARPADTSYELPDHSFQGDGLVDGLAWTDWDEIRERVYEGRGGGGE